MLASTPAVSSIALERRRSAARAHLSARLHSHMHTQARALRTRKQIYNAHGHSTFLNKAFSLLPSLSSSMYTFVALYTCESRIYVCVYAHTHTMHAF
jgi:hypothetical protein